MSQENKHTKEDLKTMQAWSLERKIQVTQTRIIEWYEHFNGQVYVSFSGGKDSTVLLDLARRIYPDIEAVFCDTRLEYPEIREFVKTFNNVEWIKPEMRFDDVIEKYGFPVISKEQAQYIREARNSKSDKLKNLRMNGINGRYKVSEKWKHLIDAPFKVSEKCCHVMKKKPFKVFSKKTGKKAIIGTMASESSLRLNSWIRNGCNSFDKTIQTSQPMSFWKEKDVLLYLRKFKIAYSKIYGDIALKNGKLYATGVDRTGCMFCMFGCHMEAKSRFKAMKETHPKQYDYCINKLGCGKVLDYIGVEY